MQPKTKAATKPIIAASGEMPTMAWLKPSSKIFLVLSMASPKIGGITIRNEKCASFSFLSPSRSPVAMVLPERERPGSVAIAWAIPIIKAWTGEMFSL